MKKILIALLVVSGIFTLAGCSNTSTEESENSLLAIDINPSIEFVLDEDGLVVSVQYNNEDAEIAAANLDFVGLPYEEAVELFIGAAVDAGYIDVDTSDNNVVITFGNEDEETEAEMQEAAEGVAQAFLEENKIGGAVLSGAVVYEELAALAEQYEISLGQARMIVSALATDDTLTFEGLVELSMDELMAIITTAHRANMAAFVEERKSQAMSLRDDLVAQAKPANDAHEDEVEAGTAETPDYEAIRADHMANIDDIIATYQAKANEMRNNAIERVNPDDYRPDVPNTDNNAESSFRLLVSDQPADIADFEYLNIPILKTRIFTVVDGQESFVEAEIDFTIDLTQLIGAASVEVLELDLEPGTYTKIELYVDQPNIDAATVDESEANIFVPSGKLMIENDFEIVEGEQLTFVFDINIVKTGPGTDYNLIPVISESGVVGEDLEEEEVEEVEMVLVSKLTFEELSVYALEDTVGENVQAYITAESLTDEETDEVVVMILKDGEWEEESVMLGEPEDVINEDLEEGEEYTWVILSEDNLGGTLFKITWVAEDSTDI